MSPCVQGTRQINRNLGGGSCHSDIAPASGLLGFCVAIGVHVCGHTISVVADDVRETFAGDATPWLVPHRLLSC